MGADAPHYATHIDGLRAIAVVAVILYHLDAALMPGGFVGVDAFFVISGFVVSRSANADAIGTPRAALAAFYARRMVRILPALVACLVVTMLAAVVLIPASWLSDTNEKTGLRAFFGVSNLILARSGNDYFAPRAEFNPFTHTWSLGVEEQFYLLFPWLFGVWVYGRPLMGLALTGVGAAASLACAAWLADVDQDSAFYEMAPRLWELAAGVGLTQVLASWPNAVPVRGKAALALLSLIGLCLSLAMARAQSTPMPDSLLPCAGTVCLLAALNGHGPAGPARQLLDLRILRRIGLRSYSLYLWHWPVFVVFRWTVGLQTISTCLLALLTAATLSALSYRWIETPPRRAHARLGVRPLVVLPLGIGIVLAGFGIASWTVSARRVLSLSTVTHHASDWYQDQSTWMAGPAGCRLLVTNTAFGGGYVLSYSRAGCAPPARSAGRLVVMGDSHAGAYLLMLRQWVMQTGREVVVYTMGGCGLFALPGAVSASCRSFRDAAVAAITARVGPGDVVFLPALRIPRIANEFALYGEAAAEAELVDPINIRRRREDASATAPLLRRWTDRGATILFEAPTPVFPAPAFRCADWFDRMNPICAGGSAIARRTIERWRRPVMDAYRRFQQADPRVHVWDTLALLCPSGTCSAYDRGRPLFFDGDHLSGYGNRFLFDDFAWRYDHP